MAAEGGEKTKRVLLEYRGIKKVLEIDEGVKEKTYLLSFFCTNMPPSSYLSLQRFDSEWQELVDIDLHEIQHKDKLKIEVLPLKEIQVSSNPSNPAYTNYSSENSVHKSVEKSLSNLAEEKQSLHFRLNIASATVSSLKDIPKPRMALGRNVSFTCSKCHYQGHRVNTCRQPPCSGFHECGNKLLHKEYREQLKQAEGEVRQIEKLLKKNAEDTLNTNLLKERTKTNFFSVMRTKLHQSNPIKYSNRSCLDNDLRILASACNHKVPPETVDLEEILASHQNKANMLKYTSGFENSGTGIGERKKSLDNYQHIGYGQTTTSNMANCWGKSSTSETHSLGKYPSYSPPIQTNHPSSHMQNWRSPEHLRQPSTVHWSSPYDKQSSLNQGYHSPSVGLGGNDSYHSPQGSFYNRSHNEKPQWYNHPQQHRNICVSPLYTIVSPQGNFSPAYQAKPSTSLGRQSNNSFSRKRLHYGKKTSFQNNKNKQGNAAVNAQDLGKKFRMSMNELEKTAKSKKAISLPEEETQDFPSENSTPSNTPPKEKIPSATTLGNDSGHKSEGCKLDGDYSQDTLLQEDSQVFDYEEWVEKQKATTD